MSRELGIEHLTQRCERYIISTLSLHNACAFYAAALQLDEETDPKQGEMFRARNLYEIISTVLYDRLIKCFVNNIVLYSLLYR